MTTDTQTLRVIDHAGSRPAQVQSWTFAAVRLVERTAPEEWTPTDPDTTRELALVRAVATSVLPLIESGAAVTVRRRACGCIALGVGSSPPTVLAACGACAAVS